MLNEIIQKCLNISGKNLTEEQQFALFINSNFEYFQYNLIDNNCLKNLKDSYGKFEFKYKKNNIDFSLILNIIDDTKYNLIIESSNKKVTHEIKMDKFMNNININNLNLDNLIPLNKKIEEYIKNYEGGFLNNIQSDINYLNINNNNKPIQLELNNNKNDFINHNLNNNNNNNQNFMPKLNGNLMGPESFNSNNQININNNNNNPFKIRYDPITPFGINYDFYPNQDGPIGPDNFNPEFDIYGNRRNNFNNNNNNNGNPFNRSPFLNPNNPYANNEIPDDLNPFGSFNPNKPNNFFGGNNFGGGNFGFI